MMSWKSLYKLRTRESDQLKTVLDLYDMQIHQKISIPDNQKLFSDGEKKQRSETSDCETLTTRNGRTETGTVVTNQKGVNVVLKEDKEFAIQWKAKGQCSRGDKCSFQHDGDEHAKPTPKTAPPSEPPKQRGRSASRNKNLRERESIWEDQSTAVQKTS